jgi:MFS family permease
MTGISIGGSIPVIYSVLGDLYPANQRSAIAAVITTGTGLGMGIGQVIAGSLDSWRLPFVIVAIPGEGTSIFAWF